MRTFSKRRRQSNVRSMVWGMTMYWLLAPNSFAMPDPPASWADRNTVLGENPSRGELSISTDRQASRSPSAVSDTTYRLRIVYVIPSNRSPQPDAQVQLIDYVLRMQAWYAEEMARLGYGPKTFAFETETDAVTPKVNFVYVDHPDIDFQGSYGERWGKILLAMDAAGLSPWMNGELLLVVAETQIQNADGSFRYGVNDSGFVGGAGFDFAGVGLVTGETLARLSVAFLTDDRPYNGLRIPEIGPYPLVQGVSFPWFEGSTLSSTSSSAQGAALHEVSHGLGLWHDFRNDSNFNGNLMGNGLRGIRGALYPELYPDEDTRLSSGSALQLSQNRFFNDGKVFTENNRPSVDVLTQGFVVPIDGQCPIEFSASDADSTLAGALLIRNGQVVAEMPLMGNEVSTILTTYAYVPGELNEWAVLVFDTQGNTRVSAAVLAACVGGVNQAPQPYVRVSQRKLKLGEEIVLDGGSSADLDGDSSRMTIEWDLNGDGVFDTLPSTEKTLTATYQTPGVYQVIARLIDEQGDASMSMPIGIRVEAPHICSGRR